MGTKSVEPKKYVRTSHGRGRTHIIYGIRDGAVTTLCGSYFVIADCPIISETIYSKTQICKRCEKSNSRPQAVTSQTAG